MSDQRGTATGQYAGKVPGYVRFLVHLLLVLFLTLSYGCGDNLAMPNEDNSTTSSRNARIGLWLAKKTSSTEASRGYRPLKAKI